VTIVATIATLIVITAVMYGLLVWMAPSNRTTAEWRHPLEVFRSWIDNPFPGMGGVAAILYLPAVGLILIDQNAAATITFIVENVAVVALVVDAVVRGRAARATR
jgi:hypothetical protein